MATQVAVANGTGTTRAELTKVLDEVQRGIPATPPGGGFGFVYASPEHDLPAALSAARARFPKVDFAGAGVTAPFTHEGRSQGVVVALITSDEMIHGASQLAAVGKDPDRAGQGLAAAFAPSAEEAKRRGLPASTTLMLIDGFAPVEPIVEAVRRGTRSFQIILGGGVGDARGIPAPTKVGLNDKAVMNGAVALHTFSRRPWGVGVGHGLAPASPRVTVTKSQQNIIQELDGKPALEVYAEFARGLGVELTPEVAPRFMIQHELGVCFFDDIYKVRVPFGAGPDGSLVCGGIIEERSQVAIMKGEPKALVSAAKAAAEEAMRGLGGADPAGVLVFSCVCRGMILDGNADEIAAIRQVFPTTPIAGFLSCGEIARYKGRLDGVHNATLVVAAIPK